MIWVVIVTLFTVSVLYCDWLIDSEKTSSIVRTTVLTAAALIAIPLALWRSRVSERQVDIAQEQYEIAHQGLLDERFRQGAEMLGSDLLSVRLGGIYALQKLSEENPLDYHIQVVRLFCAFVRHPPKDEKAVIHLSGEKYPRLREDVQAVMSAIGLRNQAGLECEDAEGIHLDLQGADLCGLHLRDANLSGANFRGADLDHAYLLGSDFTGASLVTVNLARANLVHAKMSRTNMVSVDLTDSTCQGTDFSSSSIIGGKMRKALLEGANFNGVIFGTPDLREARLHNADLTGVTFKKGTRSTNIGTDSCTTEDIYAQLTQNQLDEAVADINDPPRFDNGTVDVDTGKALVWRGKAVE